MFLCIDNIINIKHNININITLLTLLILMISQKHLCSVSLLRI